MEIKLIDAKINKNYIIKNVCIKDRNLLMALRNFGLEKGKTISVLGSNYLKKSFLVNVQGTSFAIDKHVCERVIVNE